MTNSLRDQLVAAGLASAKQAQKAEKQQRAEQQARRTQGKQGSAESSEGPKAAAERARRAKSKKAQQDREASKAQNSKTAAKAIRAQLKQIVLQHDQRAKKSKEDDVAYNFLHNKKIKRIYVSATQKQQLSDGTLVIINNDGLYHLLSKDIAAKIEARDPRWIITSHSDAEEDVDDFYKNFRVPDDLDW